MNPGPEPSQSRHRPRGARCALRDAADGLPGHEARAFYVHQPKWPGTCDRGPQHGDHTLGVVGDRRLLARDVRQEQQSPVHERAGEVLPEELDGLPDQWAGTLLRAEGVVPFRKTSLLSPNHEWRRS